MAFHLAESKYYFFFQSPGDRSLPSLCSPERSPLLPDDDQMANFMSLNLDSTSSEMEDDLSFKAPYIPIDEDLPLLIPATDLLWNSPEPEKTDTARKNCTDSW